MIGNKGIKAKIYRDHVTLSVNEHKSAPLLGLLDNLIYLLLGDSPRFQKLD
jgi:hypothetical protein